MAIYVVCKSYWIKLYIILEVFHLYDDKIIYFSNIYSNSCRRQLFRKYSLFDLEALPVTLLPLHQTHHHHHHRPQLPLGVSLVWTMMTSSWSWHVNTFCITGPSWGKSGGYRWIPLHKNGSLMQSFLYRLTCWTSNQGADDLRRRRNHVRDVTLPTCLSLCTGKYPWRHDMHN